MATRFIGVAGASSPTKKSLGGRSSSKRDRAAVSSPRDKNKFAKPDDFLERMRLREEQTRKRREARASEWRSRARADAGGTNAKPGWDDSPDVVVRVGASPE